MDTMADQEVQATFDLTDAYYDSVYRGVAHQGSVWWRYEGGIALAFFGAGLGIEVAIGQPYTPVAVFCMVVGVVELGRVMTRKVRWTRARKSRSVRGTMRITFREHGVCIDGPTAGGDAKWSAFSAVTGCESGLILRPRDGLDVMFVPRKALDDPSGGADQILAWWDAHSRSFVRTQAAMAKMR
jgi:hypothetical protein